MTFSPVLPATGALGWSFLKRTAAAQQGALAKSPEIQRDAAYFRDRIGKIDTADDLVADRRLLRITLEAFGLEADLESRAFIRKVLSDGTLKTGAFAMRLSDPRYKALTEAFGFGDFPVPNTKLSDFPDRILAQWQERRFETAIGQQNGDFRLALNTRRELAKLAAGSGSETAKWFRILGNPPLRKVMQTGLGLPDSFPKLDIDRQVATMDSKAASVFGTSGVSQFTDPARIDDLLRRFLVRSELAQQSAQPAAIDLLSQARRLSRRI